MITFDELRHREDIRTYITRADESLEALGFTEHSFAHVTRVAMEAGRLLSELGFSERTAELARIAGYLHDIGNLVNRTEHSQSGAVMAFRILDRLEMDAEEIATVVTAIGNHDLTTFDIHDRVNYSVEQSSLEFNEDKTTLTLRLTVDTQYGSVMDYFEVFMERMLLCRRAAEKLGVKFTLFINDQCVM